MMLFTEIYLTILFDNCGDPYNDTAFYLKEDAIKYIIDNVKNDPDIIEWYTEEKIRVENDEGLEEYEKDILKVTYEEWLALKLLDGGIDEKAYLEEIEIR